MKKDIINYIEKIKDDEINIDKFNLVKKKKIGYTEFSADNLNSSYRRIIEHSLYGEDLYCDIKILKEIKPEDIKEFLKNLNVENQVISVVKGK